MNTINLLPHEKDDKTELAVERALADFRSGRPVTIEEGDQIFIAQGVENTPDNVLKGMDMLAQGNSRLVLTKTRLKRLGIETNDIAAVPLPILNTETIERLALHIDATLDLPIGAPNWADRVALELARLALIIPAAIVVPVPQNVRIDPFLIKVQAEDIRRFRKLRVKRISIVSRAPVPLDEAPETEFIVFRGGEGMRDQVAIIVGKPDFSRPVYVRLHSACLTGDLFGSLKCDCGDQLRSTVQNMASHDGGVLLYLDQEGRGNGIANKIRAYKLQSQGFDTYEADEVIGFELDQRHFDFAAEMLRQLGITQVQLMTNNPLKIAALKEAGINVVSDIRVLGRTTHENSKYLNAKRERAGHYLENTSLSLCPQKED